MQSHACSPPRPPAPCSPPQSAEVHKTAALLGLQSCRSHPSTTLRQQRVVVQNPEVPAPGAGREGHPSHTVASVMQRSLPPAAAIKLVEVNGGCAGGEGGVPTPGPHPAAATLLAQLPTPPPSAAAAQATATWRACWPSLRCSPG
jgi:hypothetical protein